MENAGNAVIDFGRFCTGFLVVMGIGTLDIFGTFKLEYASTSKTEVHAADALSIALPALLAHCQLIQVPAMIMSIIGGLLIYGTIISFTMFFQEEQDF